ncbi:MAG: hypothetical protein O3A59_12110 [Nitrospirae bacterium]|nr:hypothetical protein [Nitrospirota bacterium]
MPYVFPNEDLFMGGMAVLIVALLILRVRVVRQRRLDIGTGVSEESPIEQRKGPFPLI